MEVMTKVAKWMSFFTSIFFVIVKTSLVLVTVKVYLI